MTALKILAAIVCLPLILIATMLVAFLSLPFMYMSIALIVIREPDLAEWFYDHTPLMLVINRIDL